MRADSGDSRHADTGAMDIVNQSPINNAFVSDCLAPRTELLKNGGHMSSSSGQWSLCATHPVFSVQLHELRNGTLVHLTYVQPLTVFKDCEICHTSSHVQMVCLHVAVYVCIFILNSCVHFYLIHTDTHRSVHTHTKHWQGVCNGVSVCAYVTDGRGGDLS